MCTPCRATTRHRCSASGLNAVKGDISKKADFAAAMKKATIDSPRGPFTISHSHNPVQDIYLRKVSARRTRSSGVASKALADPDAAAKM